MKSIEILSKSADGQMNIADTWPHDDRHPLDRTLASEAPREHHHVGVER